MENIFEGLKNIAKYEDIDKQEFESQRSAFFTASIGSLAYFQGSR